MSRFGGQNATGTLRRVLLRAPRPADGELWREYGWRAAPDPVEIAAEHDDLCAILEDAGAEVVLAAAALGPNPDAVYVFDPAIVCDRGAIVLRPGKEGRLGEAGAIALDLAAAGVPRRGASSRRPPPPRAGTRSGWTSEPCSSAAATARIRPGSRRCARHSPGWTSTSSTSRTGAAPAR